MATVQYIGHQDFEALAGQIELFSGENQKQVSSGGDFLDGLIYVLVSAVADAELASAKFTL